MVVAAAQASPNYSVFLDDARAIAEAQQLDFLEFADDLGTIISSAQWPAKFGYKEPLAASDSTSSPFLKKEETPAGSFLGLFAIRTVAADPDPLRAHGRELGAEVAEVATLPGAARGHRRRVEEQHDRPVGEEVAQLPRRPGLIGELEVGHRVADSHDGEPTVRTRRWVAGPTP